MKTYLTSEQATEFLKTEPVLEYPDATDTPLSPEFAEFQYPDFVGGGPNPPSLLVRTVLSEINKSPRQVLDLGAGLSSTGLYLASLGHNVTAIDDPTSTNWQNKQAQRLGLSSNFEAIPGDALQLSKADKYDIIIAEMLLHFLEPEDSRKVLAAMRLSTLVGGLNIVSVYTEINPDAERSHASGRQNLFELGALARSYSSSEWEVIRNEEGHADYPVDRPMVGDDMVLIAHNAELVVRKIAEPTPALYGYSFGETSSTTTYVL